MNNRWFWFTRRLILMACICFVGISVFAQEKDKPTKAIPEEVIAYVQNIGNASFEDVPWIVEQINNGKYKKVAKYCKKQSNNSELSVTARADNTIVMADCYALNGNREDAVEGYLRVLTYDRLYVNTSDVVRKLYAIACEYRDGVDTFMGFSYNQEAIDILIQLHLNAPGHELAPKILLDLIRIYVDTEDYGAAIVQVYAMSKKYPLSIESQESFFLLAKCYYNMALKYDQDGDNARQAMILMQDFITYYPKHPLAERARTAIAEMQNLLAGYLYHKALFYWEAKYAYQRKPEAARRYLYDMLREYPQSDYTEQAKELIAQIEASLAEQKKKEIKAQEEASAERLKAKEKRKGKAVKTPPKKKVVKTVKTKKVKQKKVHPKDKRLLMPYDKPLTQTKEKDSLNDDQISVESVGDRALDNQKNVLREE